MNQIEKSFEIEDMEKKEQITATVTNELNTRLVDMGEISALDKREVAVLDSIRGKLGRTASYDNLDEEIPEELLKQYVKVMFDVEQDRLVKNKLTDIEKPEVAKPILDRYAQAKALGVEITVDSNVAYVLELPETAK